MKRSLLALPALLVLGVAGFALAGTTSTVTLTPTGPSTTAVNIVTGDSVVWTNAAPGTVGLELPSLSVTTQLPPASSYSRAFTTTGRVQFHEVVGTGKDVKSFRGSVNVGVATLSGTVSLKASSAKVKAGSFVTLSGTVPVNAALPAQR